MNHTKPVAIVGLGAIMPDAPDVPSFWQNIQSTRYSIRDVTPQRWDAALYYDPDPAVPDKTYAKIGAIVTGFVFEPFKWGIAIPPRVLQQMDEAQQWALAAARQALMDYGHPQRPLDGSRTAVILGNALGGEKHYITTLRIRAPEVAAALQLSPAFQALPAETQAAIAAEMLAMYRASVPEINEDTMPGELGNVIAGRIANVFNLQGPNFITDAACASSLAALQAAVEGLNDYQFDAVLTGGVDRSMGVEGYVKFSKIGALSPDGSRPYADGANGFVMGEGAAIFLLKRLDDAEKDGDRIYAVIRGIGSSSDGKGKGITAPNPVGQQQAVERAWKNAGVSPATIGLVEGHGTSTRVGDVVEVNSLTKIFEQFDLPVGSVALGSVKSNIGHLKSAAGAAGMLKVALALHHKVLPPSANFERPNPNIEFDRIPFAVNTVHRPWEVKSGQVRRAGVSSFGFGGTNFHVVVDEYLPGILQGEKPLFTGVDLASAAAQAPLTASTPTFANPYRGLLFLSAASAQELRQKVTAAAERVRAGEVPPSVMPPASEIAQPHRLAIDYDTPEELLKRLDRSQKGFENPDAWFALTAHGVFHGEGQPGKVAFLFPGQGSQYVNMLKDFCTLEPAVQATFDEADAIMEPILGRPLTSFIYVEGDEASQAEAEAALRNTEITQPAMLTANVALTRLMERFGFQPDLVIGHSLGEYAALVASGVLSFAQALQIVSARGREMTRVALDDNGAMAAVSAPLEQVEALLKQVEGYVVIANINSPTQCVIGGSTEGVDAALVAFQAAGLQGTRIPVSHAFHTRIVAPASQPLREVIASMDIQPARLPVVANVTGELYPDGKDAILDILAQQVASPVQFIRGVRTLYDQGGRVFVEVGPKRVLSMLAKDILTGQPGAAVFATNHPREGALLSFNKALCGLLAAGVPPVPSAATTAFAATSTVSANSAAVAAAVPEPATHPTASHPPAAVDDGAVKAFVLQMVSEKTGYPVEMLDLDLDLEADLGIDTVKQAELFAALRSHYNIPRREDLRLSDYNTLARVVDFMAQALPGNPAAASQPTPEPQTQPAPAPAAAPPAVAPAVRLATPAPAATPALSDGRLPLTGSVVISGAGLGLPGRSGTVFDDRNIDSILSGEIRIEPLPESLRQDMLEKRVTRLIKSEAGAVMQPLDQLEQTIKLGGQRGAFDLTADFGVPEERVGATDIATQLAIAAGIEALRDAGIPLVMAYRQTSKGTFLPDRWKLPEALRDETGVIFGSAFPGLDEMAEETGRYTQYRALSAQAGELNRLLALIPTEQADLRQSVMTRIQELMTQLEGLDYQFDRRFIFRILSMGHSQFAEYIGARGPNTHVNAACATTTHALAVAEDWIRAGRARRVVVIAGDDVTSGPLAEWVGTGLMASGAATTEGDPRLAILPFDRRRNGMIMGMGGAALVVESEDAVRERGMRAICEVLATNIANSAFHGTRLDVEHVSQMMDRLVSLAEQLFGIRREEIASRTVFVSHETYTPARGGSAAAEIRSLRQVFGAQADQVVIANTKGYTGHTMGVGVEDVVAVKALERGVVPPIANIQEGFEPDPDLGNLRLSTGGDYPVQFALRLGAGFGSQIAMSLLRKVSGAGERIDQNRYQTWLASVAGYDKAELEVEQRTLRIRHAGAPLRPPAPSTWQYGQGPTLWAESPLTESAPSAASLAHIPTQAVAPLPAAPRPVTTVPVAASSPAGSEAVKAFVLSAVSEKTGYPVEMLDLDLDLEADLGIDTVKQAELFAAIRTNYNIPRREDLRLSDYNTLAKVVGFMQDALAGGTPAPVAVEPQPVPVAQPVPLPAAAPIYQDVKAFVLSAVSEKTGYPVEMLDLDLDLEADLGIDTVKQAELFAAIRTNYNIPRREDLRLSDYNTLAKVVGFMQDALAIESPAPSAVEPQPAVPEPDQAESAAAQPSPTHLEQVLASAPQQDIPRRVPLPVLRPRLDLCQTTGATLDESSRILVVADRGKVAQALAKRLRGRKAAVQVLTANDPAALAQQAADFAAQGIVEGVYFLPALDPEPDLPHMDADTWHSELDHRAHALYEVIRALPNEPFLLCATRMGGLHGLGADGAANPLGGAVSGFTKALAMERPTALVKAVDFEPDTAPTAVAASLVEETLADPGVVEVGWRDDLRFGFTLAEAVYGEAAFDLTKETVFLISGGSGGITAPVVLDLASNSGGTFYLLSRTPLPSADNPDLQMLRADRNAYKAEMGRRLREQGEKATPAVVDKLIAGLERALATQEMMAAAQKAGASVHYLVCDVTDQGSVAAAIDQVLAQSGHVDVFIHAAGQDRSHKLHDKPAEEFRQVLAVKADGFFNIFKALEQRASLPRAVAFFSSLAGRFGNSGQTDYAAGNDLLNKLAAALPRQYPGLKALALDWGAWSEVGMASRGYIPELMHRAGIEMLHPANAAPLVRRELQSAASGSEVVLAGALGMLEIQRQTQGGLDLEKANRALRAGKPIHIMLTSAAGYNLDDGIILQADLDPEQEPFLRDHTLNGIPLLPGVMGIEGLSNAARHIASVLASQKGSFRVTGLEQIQFLSAFKFYRNQPRRVTWKARVERLGDRLLARTSLESTQTRPGRDAECMLHFTATVHLQPADEPLEACSAPPPHWNGSKKLTAKEIYKLYFHGPSFQVLEAVQQDDQLMLGKLRRDLPPLTAGEQELTTPPLLVELCLQTAGIWEIGATGVMALPRAIGSLRVFRGSPNGVPVYAAVTPRTGADGRPSFDAVVVDARGRVFLEMDDYRTEPLPYGVEAERLEPLQRWLKG